MIEVRYVYHPSNSLSSRYKEKVRETSPYLQVKAQIVNQLNFTILIFYIYLFALLIGFSNY